MKKSAGVWVGVWAWLGRREVKRREEAWVCVRECCVRMWVWRVRVCVWHVRVEACGAWEWGRVCGAWARGRAAVWVC